MSRKKSRRLSSVGKNVHKNVCWEDGWYPKDGCEGTTAISRKSRTGFIVLLGGNEEVLSIPQGPNVRVPQSEERNIVKGTQ